MDIDFYWSIYVYVAMLVVIVIRIIFFIAYITVIMSPLGRGVASLKPMGGIVLHPCNTFNLNPSKCDSI